MKREKRRDPTEGDVFAKDGRHRRIVGALGGGIVYSVGGDKNRVCKVTTFRRWARHAKLLHEARGSGDGGR